jgi:hypothetical protein
MVFNIIAAVYFKSFVFNISLFLRIFKERERVNVIAVDWGNGALFPLYNDAI